jgi:hypothetical protein
MDDDILSRLAAEVVDARNDRDDAQLFLSMERDRSDLAERENCALMSELTSLYKANTAAIEALGFYAQGWPNGIDGGNKARVAIDAILAIEKSKAKPVAA